MLSRDSTGPIPIGPVVLHCGGLQHAVGQGALPPFVRLVGFGERPHLSQEWGRVLLEFANCAPFCTLQKTAGSCN